jgi:hypothetical protein
VLEPGRPDGGSPLVAAPVPVVQVAATDTGEDQRCIEPWRYRVEGPEDTGGQRYGAGERARGLPGQLHLPRRIDAADVQQAVVAVDVAAFERQPLLGAESRAGGDDWDHRAELDGLADRRLATERPLAQVIEIYGSRRAAEEDLRAVLSDEPSWAGDISVLELPLVAFPLGSRSPN